MPHHYPYPFKHTAVYKKLRKGQDYDTWHAEDFDVAAALLEVEGPIVEIGGPSAYGFYFVDEHELPSKPVITNISPTPSTSDDQEKEHAALVDEVFDARHMPYKDESIGMFLMTGMSMTSDWYMELPEAERDQKGEQIDKEFDVAQLEMEQVAIGTLAPADVQYAQRIPIYLEMRRCLKPGGLILTDGHDTEINILQRLGFEIAAYIQEHIRPEQGWDGIYYEFVAKKPLTPKKH